MMCRRACTLKALSFRIRCLPVRSVVPGECDWAIGNAVLRLRAGGDQGGEADPRHEEEEGPGVDVPHRACHGGHPAIKGHHLPADGGEDQG